MNNQIQLRKSNGEGFKSKNSAINAWRKFRELNQTVFNAQAFSHVTAALPDNTYEIRIEPETDSIWAYPLDDSSRVIYRTVSDLKYDRPMIDGRPQSKTAREKESTTTNYEMVMEDDEDGLEAMAQAFEDYKREMEEKLRKLNEELAQAKAECEQLKKANVAVKSELITAAMSQMDDIIDGDSNIIDKVVDYQYVNSLMEDYLKASNPDIKLMCESNILILLAFGDGIYELDNIDIATTPMEELIKIFRLKNAENLDMAKKVEDDEEQERQALRDEIAARIADKKDANHFVEDLPF